MNALVDITITIDIHTVQLETLDGISRIHVTTDHCIALPLFANLSVKYSMK
jgi:hypothetical protein